MLNRGSLSTLLQINAHFELSNAYGNLRLNLPARELN